MLYLAINPLATLSPMKLFQMYALTTDAERKAVDKFYGQAWV